MIKNGFYKGVSCNRWYRNNKLHRENGPAIEYTCGDKEWYWKGKRHRKDGPAIEYDNGNKEWYWRGKLHRYGLPAAEHINGKEYWYMNGIKLTEEEIIQTKRERNLQLLLK